MKAEQYLKEKNIPPDARFGNRPSVYVKDLLQDYAKQEAIEFLEWIDSEYTPNWSLRFNEAYQKFKDDKAKGKVYTSHG